MTPHRITSSPCSFVSFPRFYVWVPPSYWYYKCSTWYNIGMCLKLFWGEYFHKYVSAFLKIPFSRSVESWHAYQYSISSTRNFLLRYMYAPDGTFSSRKMKKLPTVGGTPLPYPPPARSLRSLGLGRFAPSQRLCPPKKKNVLRHCTCSI